MNCNCSDQVQNQGPQSYDFLCVAGDDFLRQLQFVDGDTEQPIDDIGDLSFYMAIYDSWTAEQAGAEPLIYLDTYSDNFIVTDVDSATVNLIISSQQTKTITIPPNATYDNNVPQRSCVYDLVGVDGSGNIQTEMRGNFIFQQKLTKI